MRKIRLALLEQAVVRVRPSYTGSTVGTPWLVPTPLDVADALWDGRDFLPEQFWVTFVETLGGFGLAILIGIPSRS